MLFRSRERGVKLLIPEEREISRISEGIGAQEIIYKNLRLKIPLMGEHQIYNAVTAVETALLLKNRGYAITDNYIECGVNGTHFTGRLEVIRQNPLCIIDAAHNPDGVLALAKTIDALFKGKKIIAIMGMFADKDYKYCIPEIAKRSSAFIAITPPSSRALAAETAKEIAKDFCENTFAAKSLGEAADMAMSLAGGDGVILSCGSLSFIGEIKRILKS